MIKDSAPPPTLEEAETCAADSVDKTPFNLFWILSANFWLFPVIYLTKNSLNVLIFN